MKKVPLILLAFIFLLFSVAALASEEIFPAFKKQLIATYSSLTINSTKPIPEPIFEPIRIEVPTPDLKINLPIREITKEYDNHLVAGENNGFGLVENEDHLGQLIQEKKLVLVSQGKGYRVGKLTHSYPYLTPRSKVILEELGQAFQSLGKNESFFTITSVTRTPEQQTSLKKRNRNATAGISSHSYGVSFDISYIRFNGKKGSNRSAQKKLESVLKDFQEADKLFFIKERQQRCYHITIR